MKITTFDPIILTKDADSVIKTFEALGFEKTHAPVTPVDDKEVQGYRMKNADGYHVDVSNTTRDITQDEMIIRMNVDDFEEAYNILTAHGFKNALGDGETIDTKSAKGAGMVSPSGFRIALVKHIKK